MVEEAKVSLELKLALAMVGGLATALWWMIKKLLDSIEGQLKEQDEELADLHDRITIIETNYDHCCRNRGPKP